MRQSIGYDGKPTVSPNPSMELPEPETCGTCSYVRRCLAVGYTGSPARTSCDFYPVRFARARAPGTGGGTP